MGYQIQFSEVWPHLDELMWGALLTLRLSAMAMMLGLVLAIICTFLRSTYPRVFGPIIEAYVQIIRNTPFLVQIFLVFFGLPTVGIKMGATECGVFALVVNAGAYTSEIIRAGVESIPRGHTEAGFALGLRRNHVFFLIILRPALYAVYPAVTSQFTLLLLASSVLSVISAEELTAVANNLSSQTFRTIEIYVVVGAFYLGMTLCISLVLALLGRLIFWNEHSAIGRPHR